MRRGRARGRRWILGFAGATLAAAGGVATYRATSVPHQLERLRAEIAIHQRLGREAEAARASERLLALDPADLEALERVAAHRVATGRGEEAERLLRATLDGQGQAPRPRLVVLLAEHLHAEGRDAEAAALLAPLLGDLAALPRVDDRVRAALLGGRVLAETGDLEGAHALLVECGRLRDGFGLRNDTGDPVVVDLLALADVLGRLGRWGEAEAALRRAHRLAPDGAITCRLLAAALERRGAADEAVAVLAEHWRTCPSQRPEQAAAYLLTLGRAGRLDEARAAAEEVAAVAPWAPPLVRGLAAAPTDAAAAGEAARDVVRLGGPGLEAHVVAARAALDEGDLSGARAALVTALEASPGSADLELELLRVEQRLGELAVARARAVRLLGVAEARDGALEVLLALAADDPAALPDARGRLQELLPAAPDDPWLRAVAAALTTLSGDVDAGARALCGLAAVADLDLAGALGVVARGAEAKGDPLEAMNLLGELARRDARLAPARLVRARFLLSLDRADLARQELDAALAADARLVGAWAQLADLLEASGDLSGATAALAKACELAPGDVGLARTLATLRQRAGEPAAAVSLLAPLADAYPGDADLRVALARARALAGQRGLAAAEYEAALRLDPACASAYGLAALHTLGRAHGDARRVLEGAPVRLLPHLRAALAAGRALDGDDAAALEALRGGEPAAASGAARAVTEALLLARMGQPDAAAALLEQAPGLPDPVRRAALSASPEAARTFFVTLLLRALGFQAELAERAGALASAGDPLGGDDADGGELLLTWWTLDGLDPAATGLRLQLAERLAAAAPTDLVARLLHADALEAAGEAARAREALEALAAEHDVADAWERLGDARQAAGDREGAVEAFERALARAPGRLVSLNNLAFALGADPDARPRAVALARRAVELAPDVAAVHDTLGWLLWLEGDAEAALPLLRQAVALAPLDPTARFHLARVREAMGDRAQARALVRLALLSGTSFAERAAAEALHAELGGER